MSELANPLLDSQQEHTAIIIQFPPILRPESGYQPRPTDEEIDEIVGEYMGWRPEYLALSGLSKNLQEVVARVHLKSIQEGFGDHDDLLLWTNYYTAISEPTEKTYN